MPVIYKLNFTENISFIHSYSHFMTVNKIFVMFSNEES